MVDLLYMNQKPSVVSASEVLSVMCPALAEGRLGQALEQVRQLWTLDQMLPLLQHETVDVRKVVLLVLGHLQDPRALPGLALGLQDADPVVVQMAEHAWWTLLFSLGQGTAPSQVLKGVDLLEQGDLAQAIQYFDAALLEDPNFIEAYHQRAMAKYLLDDYPPALADCQAALALLPEHFGAWGTMGNCYVGQREWLPARTAYLRSLALHPHQEGIIAALNKVDIILHAPNKSV
jgi:tetratricopeptide (TPR) repeat protein